MRRTYFALNALLAVSLFAAPAALPQEEENPDPKAPPVVKTEVAGEIPVDLRGVWLIVGNGNLQNHADRFRNTAEIEAIRQTDGKIDVQPVLVELPADMQQQLDEANKRVQAWQPSPEQVDRLSRSLETLKTVDPMRYYRHTVRIIGPTRYEDAIKPQVRPFVKDGKFAIEVEHVYRPQPVDGGLQLMSDSAVYSVEKTEPAMLEGQHGRTILAAGFVPVPVATVGPFTMRRLRGPEALPAAPGGSVADRFTGFLGNLFRGCR